MLTERPSEAEQVVEEREDVAARFERAVLLQTTNTSRLRGGSVLLPPPGSGPDAAVAEARCRTGAAPWLCEDVALREIAAASRPLPTAGPGTERRGRARPAKGGKPRGKYRAERRAERKRSAVGMMKSNRTRSAPTSGAERPSAEQPPGAADVDTAAVEGAVDAAAVEGAVDHSYTSLLAAGVGGSDGSEVGGAEGQRHGSGLEGGAGGGGSLGSEGMRGVGASLREDVETGLAAASGEAVRERAGGGSAGVAVEGGALLRARALARVKRRAGSEGRLLIGFAAGSAVDEVEFVWNWMYWLRKLQARGRTAVSPFRECGRS